MSNPFEDMERALSLARDVNRAVDNQTAAMARMIAGRLRLGTKEANWQTIDALKVLKAELQNFDARTGRWKDHA